MVFVPKFQDESTLIWYYGKDEKQLELRQVSRIIPGQRTVSMIQRLSPYEEMFLLLASLFYYFKFREIIC